MHGIISRRYGRAMFELAKTENKVEKFLEQLKEIKNVSINNPELVKIFTHPKISLVEKLKLVDDVFATGFDNEVRDFLKLLLSKDRIDQVVKMIDDYEELYYDYKNIVLVKVTTASVLEEPEMKALNLRLEEVLGKKVIIKSEVDSAIIGGMLISTKEKVIDATVRGELSKIRENLLHDVR